jgi:hypothetical protein
MGHYLYSTNESMTRAFGEMDKLRPTNEDMQIRQ